MDLRKFFSGSGRSYYHKRLSSLAFITALAAVVALFSASKAYFFVFEFVKDYPAPSFIAGLAVILIELSKAHFYTKSFSEYFKTGIPDGTLFFPAVLVLCLSVWTTWQGIEIEATNQAFAMADSIVAPEIDTTAKAINLGKVPDLPDYKSSGSVNWAAYSSIDRAAAMAESNKESLKALAAMEGQKLERLKMAEKRAEAAASARTDLGADQKKYILGTEVIILTLSYIIGYIISRKPEKNNIDDDDEDLSDLDDLNQIDSKNFETLRKAKANFVAARSQLKRAKTDPEREKAQNRLDKWGAAVLNLGGTLPDDKGA